MMKIEKTVESFLVAKCPACGYEYWAVNKKTRCPNCKKEFKIQAMKKPTTIGDSKSAFKKI